MKKETVSSEGNILFVCLFFYSRRYFHRSKGMKSQTKPSFLFTAQYRRDRAKAYRHIPVISGGQMDLLGWLLQFFKFEWLVILQKVHY